MSTIIRHDRDELLSLLTAACPIALSRLPKPEKLPFISNGDVIYLTIGETIASNGSNEGKSQATCTGDMPTLSYLEPDPCSMKGWVKLEGVLKDVLGMDHVLPQDPALRIIVAFLFVYASHKETFGDQPNGPAVEILARRLNRLAPKKTPVLRKYERD